MSPVLLWVGLAALGAGPGAMPWANVTPEDEATATALRDLGNKALYEGLAEEAADRYREALTHWDHPAIHYNYAQALLKLFKPLECHEHLEAATRYGAAPLEDEEKYNNAVKLRTTVETQLTHVEIDCDEPGARVSVDERQDVLVCPGSLRQWMLPGTHVFRIEKPEFLPRKKTVELPRGKHISVDFKIYTQAQAKRSRQRWPWWFPWVVLSSGAAAGASAAAFHVHAYNLLTGYDNAIAHCAAFPTVPGFSGCPQDQGQALAPMRSRGYTEQNVAWGLYVVGGAALFTGSALLGVNLPETYYDDPELDLRTVAVTPVVGPGLGGVRLSIAF